MRSVFRKDNRRKAGAAFTATLHVLKYVVGAVAVVVIFFAVLIALKLPVPTTMVAAELRG